MRDYPRRGQVEILQEPPYRLVWTEPRDDGRSRVTHFLLLLLHAQLCAVGQQGCVDAA